MSLRSRLTVWREPVSLVGDWPTITLDQVAQEVDRLLGAVPVNLPDLETLDLIYQHLKGAHEHDDLLSVPKRILRLAPWVAFESWHGEMPLVNDGQFVAGLSLALRQKESIPGVISLAQMLLLHYEPGNSTHERLRKVVRDVLQKSTRPRARNFLSNATIFGLLRSDGPEFFSQNFIDGSESAFEIIQEAGLTGPLEYRGFIRHAYRELASKIQERLESRKMSSSELSRLLTLAEDSNAQKRELRFPLEVNHILVDSLLLPFESRDPEKKIQDLIKSFLMCHIGDPRLRRERWEGVDERALRVIRHWMVAVTLEDFFRILDEATKRDSDSDADRHWPYRRAFWTAYLNRDQISEAWVVLGWRVAEDTRHVLSELSSSYGELNRSSGARPSHAVLIMQIGSLIITEWSHSGKFRVWHTGNREAPQFYKRVYHRFELIRAADYEGSHHGAVNGRWQEKLSDYIGSHTGIRVSLRELMPRR